MKIRSGILSLFAALSLLAVPVLAGFDAGLAAYKAGDYQTALPELLSAAEADHARAQYTLGKMHNEGKGVALDRANAVHWWQKAAAQNHAQAQFSLSACSSPAAKASRRTMWLPICGSASPPRMANATPSACCK
jgi:TPR repeat protein